MTPSSSVSTAPWIANPMLRWGAAICAAVAAGLLLFRLLDIPVLGHIGMPHEFCYVRDPKLISLHVASDLLIGLAYVSISATLGYLVYRASQDIPFHWVLLAFGLFIVSCGMTHFMEVWVIWEPVYWLSGYVKVVTAAASVATAIALFPVLPKIFRLVESARESERRRVEIEQLNQELERFNYSVAHDLRAPLRGITGFGDVLREDFGDQIPPAAKAYIERMQNSVARMDALITDLLKYSTIGRRQLQLKPVALEGVLLATRAVLEPEAQAHNAELIFPEKLPAVLADETLLLVVLQNLIGNAMKFVAPGVRPRIEIACATQAGVVTVTITDNGLGIAPEYRAKVFQIFERFHPEFPGTGMGLAIVHRAIERLGGKIGVRSAPMGTGSQFWLELPAAPARGAS